MRLFAVGHYGPNGRARITIDGLGARWPDGRVGTVREHAGEHVDLAHWQVVAAERDRHALAAHETRQREYADEERRANYRACATLARNRRDLSDDGSLDFLENDRV